MKESQQTVCKRISPGVDGWKVSHASIVFVSTNLVLFLTVVYFWVSFGSIHGGIGYHLRGETLLVDAAEKTFGTAAPGDQVHVTFRLMNRGRQKIRILGCFALCNCMVPDDLPFALDANASWDFTVSIAVAKSQQRESGKPRDLNLPLTLFTSSPQQPRIHLTVKGEVRSKATSLSSHL